jgi:hypothetical protein
MTKSGQPAGLRLIAQRSYLQIGFTPRRVGCLFEVLENYIIGGGEAGMAR